MCRAVGACRRNRLCLLIAVQWVHSRPFRPATFKPPRPEDQAGEPGECKDAHHLCVGRPATCNQFDLSQRFSSVSQTPTAYTDTERLLLGRVQGPLLGASIGVACMPALGSAFVW